MNEYVLPNFDKLKPNRIEKVNNNIKSSKLYNPEIELKPTRNMYLQSLNKLLKDEHLMSRDYKMLLFYLDDIESRNLFNKLYNKFYSELDYFRTHKKFLRPLTYYIYNFYDTSKNLVEIYNVLIIVGKKLNDRDRYKCIKNKITQNKNTNIFLNDIRKEFYNCKDEEDIENIMKKVFMKKTDKFYLACMVKFIIENHNNENLYREFAQSVKLMDLSLKKEVFVGILKQYVDVVNVDNYPDRWFRLILEYLDEPYSSTNTKWNGIDENLKEVFRRWNNSTQLYNFFMNITGYVDKERLEFWKGHIDNIYRIRYYEHLEKALVMEFKNHVFIEFAKHGNASYFYDKKVKNIDDITMNSHKYRSASALKSKILGKQMIHSGWWQDKFDVEISNLGYKRNRW